MILVWCCLCLDVIPNNTASVTCLKAKHALSLCGITSSSQWYPPISSANKQPCRSRSKHPSKNYSAVLRRHWPGNALRGTQNTTSYARSCAISLPLAQSGNASSLVALANGPPSQSESTTIKPAQPNRERGRFVRV